MHLQSKALTERQLRSSTIIELQEKSGIDNNSTRCRFPLPCVQRVFYLMTLSAARWFCEAYPRVAYSFAKNDGTRMSNL